MAIPLSFFPARFPKIFHPYPHWCHLDIKICVFCFTLFSRTFFCSSTIFPTSFRAQVYPPRTFTPYAPCVGLSPHTYSLFFSLIPPLYCSVAHDQFLPFDSTRCVVDQLLPCSYNLRFCPTPLLFDVNCTYAFQQFGNFTVFTVISSWNSRCSSISNLSILHLYNFLVRLFRFSLVCAFCPH